MCHEEGNNLFQEYLDGISISVQKSHYFWTVKDEPIRLGSHHKLMSENVNLLT